ncbi:MAG: hypothetical protein JNK15_00870, partial [Planctomycetes bacterium]|nr:hypothetical protein [Planctomycetota bacterium]
GLARRFPALWCDGATCVAVWTNDRPTGRVWTNRSLDGGTTWQATDTRLDLGVTLPTSVAVGPIDVLGAGATVHAFWSQGWTHYQRSLDGGATWLAQAQTLPAAGGMPLQHLVDTALAGSIVFAVDDQGQMVRSGDGGTTWAHVTNTGVAKVHEVAIDGNQVVVAGWNGQTTNAVFLVTTSLDGGLTWQNAPLALPSPSTVVLMHAIARSGQLFVHIEVPGYAGDAIRSVDGGNSWHLISGPVGGGFDVGERRTIHVANEPIAFPQLPQFHVYVGMGSSVRGSATPGSGGAAPNLTSVGLPVRGASTTLQVSAALGGMPGLLGLSFAPPATVPLGSATIHLSSLDVAIAFLATGAVGNPAAGTFALPIAVPPGTSLVGASLVAQALVLDGAAVDGFTVTNALELWLR